LIEVEEKDTVLHTESYPVSYNGEIRHLIKRAKGIFQYVKIVYNIGGDDWTIIEDFIKRIELPIIDNNTFEDSLVDSINVLGELIHGRYLIKGNVLGYDYDGKWGEVYKIDLTKISSIVSAETTIVDTSNTREYYAPDVGMVRFETNAGDFHLIEYQIF
jgi:hypothetical protein